MIRRADLLRNPETRIVQFQGEPYGARVSLFIAHHRAALRRHPSAEIFVVHTGRALLAAGDQQG